MALYVRYLRLVGHDVEVTVSRHGASYLAVLRIFVAGPDSAVLHELKVESAGADESDRAAQTQARNWLEARQVQGGSQPRPMLPSG